MLRGREEASRHLTESFCCRAVTDRARDSRTWHRACHMQESARLRWYSCFLCVPCMCVPPPRLYLILLCDEHEITQRQRIVSDGIREHTSVKRVQEGMHMRRGHSRRHLDTEDTRHTHKNAQSHHSITAYHLCSRGLSHPSYASRYRRVQSCRCVLVVPPV